MTKGSLLLALATALAVGSAISSDALSAQEAVGIQGTVVDDGTGEPIDGATVRLADASGSARETITGPDGAFAFPGVAPGAYTLAVRRFGYELLSTPLEIGAQAPPRLDVRLTPQAIPLQPLEVGVEGRPPRLVESGFYDRMEEGWGTYFEPQWIEASKRGFVRLADFMSTLQMRAPLPRCPQIPVYLDRRAIGAADGSGTSRSYSLNPGGTFRSPEAPPPTLLEELSVHDLGAAELYQPGSKIPFFAWDGTSMTCGAIILWSNWTAETPEIPKIEVELCDPAGRPGQVAVDGLVEDEVTRVRLPAAHVFASYANPGDPSGLERVETVVRTDSLGRYRLCEVPADVALELTAAYGPHRGQPSVVVAEAGVEAGLAVTVTSPGRITGVVVNERTEHPLEAASVTVAGTDVRVTTDRAGRFSLEGLSPGTHRITALCGGFDLRVREVELAEGQQASVVIGLRSKGAAGRARCSA
ncbi:MAG: carboxypeptidase regulatory-like domain-containing protein [Gemmatimonadota bacterium]|uniref:carboxypeptidase regulatory-like domain-containing protein n=1 Tax=Candidatus Palauibacter scopulicola TaxID=3056741 RepID=UPI00238EFEB1|nr:carboxypeptidase regulatory-like domain-containing protein [Candidatus Palauibacter scopulicola]MDE2661937.1 carboxypeptidase regulatory-like domain-containing protein [Candidatus Palauibacter scopulicola]